MGRMVLDEFFVNSCVLCSVLFIIHQIYRKFKVTVNSSVYRRIVVGVIQGVFGSILMHYGIHLQDNVLIDLRSIPIMRAAQVGGWVSSILSALIIIVARLIFYPLSTSSILNVFVLSAAGIAFGVISLFKMKRQTQWVLMTGFYVLLIGSTMGIVIHGPRAIAEIFAQYAIAVVYGAYIAELVLSFMSKSESKLDRLNKQAQTDFLTGLNNARTYAREINDAFDKAKAKNEPLSLLSIDIDHFKRVNDTHGHPAGDEILKQIGDILAQHCRSIDIVSRNGGEEFSIILPTCDEIFAKSVAERIRKAIENWVFVVNNDTLLRITVSIGVATVNNYENVHLNHLIHFADEALYVAKSIGRNRICSKLLETIA